MNEEYIKLGDKEISYLDFLNKVNSEAESYLSTKSWARLGGKRERGNNLFRTYYQNIISNPKELENLYKTGTVTDPGNLSSFETSIYGDAAWYILDQLLRSSNRTQKTEDKKPEDTTKTEKLSKYKGLDLKQYISTEEFGGLDSTEEGLLKRWNTYYNTPEKRREELIAALTGFAKNLDKYENKEGLVTKIQNAITALTNNDENVNRSLNVLGLDPNSWLNQTVVAEETPIVTPGSSEAIVQTESPISAEESKKEDSLLKSDWITITSGTAKSPKTSLTYSNWKEHFTDARERGLINMTQEEVNQIYDYIDKYYARNTPKGEKYISGFPELVIKNGKLYQRTKDSSERRRILGNYNSLRHISNNPVTIKESKLSTYASIASNLGRFRVLNPQSVHSTINVDLALSNADKVIPKEDKVKIGKSTLGISREFKKLYFGVPYMRSTERKVISLGDSKEVVDTNSPRFNEEIKIAVLNLLKKEKVTLTNKERQELISRGWLKQGGIINKPVNLIISEFLKKLK